MTKLDRMKIQIGDMAVQMAEYTQDYLNAKKFREDLLSSDILAVNRAELSMHAAAVIALNTEQDLLKGIMTYRKAHQKSLQKKSKHGKRK